jgi:hypothetical protein
MKTNVNETASEVKCCEDYCTQNFTGTGQGVQNSYLCAQTPFTNADLWNIQRQQRIFASRVLD